MAVAAFEAGPDNGMAYVVSRHGVAETIDWAKIMLLLHTTVLEVDLVRDTLNVLLKFEADIEVANKQIASLTQKARQEAGLPV